MFEIVNGDKPYKHRSSPNGGMTVDDKKSKEKATSCREYEREACAVAGKCICTSYPCAKELIARVRKHAFDTYPSVTMENGRGKDDGGKWDPEHMQHPKHKEIGTWAQKNCYGQVRIYMCI